MEGEGSSSSLSSQFPPGFRFHPTDEELITQYLWKKATASLPSDWAIIADVDLYKFNPWELPERALFGQGEWFFFSPRDRKYPNGVRPNRAAASGYWKATGTDKPILSSGGIQCIGVKKALVFYKGRPPKGTKTDWVMQEYRLLDSMAPSQTLKQKSSMRLDDWVLCRVRMKGNFTLESDEMQTDKSSFTTVQAEEKVVKEKGSSSEWREHLTYLLQSPPQGRERIGDGSDHGFTWSSDHFDCVNYAVPQQQQQQEDRQHEQQQQQQQQEDRQHEQQQQQHQYQHHRQQPQKSSKEFHYLTDSWFSQSE